MARQRYTISRWDASAVAGCLERSTTAVMARTVTFTVGVAALGRSRIPSMPVAPDVVWLRPGVRLRPREAAFLWWRAGF